MKPSNDGYCFSISRSRLAICHTSSITSQTQEILLEDIPRLECLCSIQNILLSSLTCSEEIPCP